MAYILSSNFNRRHMTKGQRAMTVVMACSISEQTLRDGSDISGASLAHMGRASTVRQHAPELVEQVLGATRSLDDAYEIAKQEKARKEVVNQETQRLGRILAQHYALLCVESASILPGEDRFKAVAPQLHRI